MINSVWLFLIASSCFYSFFTGNITTLNAALLPGIRSGLSLVLELSPMLLLWMGLMRLCEKSGLLEKLSNFLRPFLSLLFPKLKKDSPSLGYIASNIACNMLGLGSAATPFGLKAMQELKKENENKEEASTSMITFLVLNTAGVTIIPTTVIALRTSYFSNNPTGIILPSLIATTIASMGGLLLDYCIRRKEK